MQSDVEIGKMITLLIQNHAKNHFTPKKALKDIAGSNFTPETLHLLDNQLSNYDISLVGIKDNHITSYTDSLSLFIIRKRHETSVTDEFKKLIFLLSIIFLEGESISRQRLISLAKIDDSELNSYKIYGYIKFEKYMEEEKVKLGWRFYAEFKGFDPALILKGAMMDFMVDSQDDEKIKKMKTIDNKD